MHQKATFFKSRKAVSALPLKQLEDENAKLKKLVADLSLEREMLQDVIRQQLVRPVRKRKLVDAVCSQWDGLLGCAFDAIFIH